MPFEYFLKSHGIRYSVQRANGYNHEENGLPDTNYVGFMPIADVKDDDILINPSGDRYHVIRTETEFFHGKPHFLKAFYQTEKEYNAVKQFAAPVFNIQNAYNSLIGTENQTTINYNSTISEMRQAVSADMSADKEQLEKIVSLLEMVVNDQVPASKGMFSKFRDVMERNSWITGSVANALLSWLLTKTL